MQFKLKHFKGKVKISKLRACCTYLNSPEEKLPKQQCRTKCGRLNSPTLIPTPALCVCKIVTTVFSAS